MAEGVIENESKLMIPRKDIDIKITSRVETCYYGHLPNNGITLLNIVSKCNLHFPKTQCVIKA